MKIHQQGYFKEEAREKAKIDFVNYFLNDENKITSLDDLIAHDYVEMISRIFRETKMLPSQLHNKSLLNGAINRAYYYAIDKIESIEGNKLHGLNLENYQCEPLKILPRDVGKYTHLEYLYLASNKLFSLPLAIGDLIR